MRINDIIQEAEKDGIDLIVVNEGGQEVIKSFTAYMKEEGAETLRQYSISPRQRSQTPANPALYTRFPAPPRKDSNKYLRMAKEKGLVPKEMEIEEFNNNPKNRFEGTPTPDNIAILVDDYVFIGQAVLSCVEDLEKLGYQKDKIYIISWDACNKTLYDAELKALQGFPVYEPKK